MTPLPDDQGLLLRAIKSEYMRAIVGIRTQIPSQATIGQTIAATPVALLPPGRLRRAMSAVQRLAE